MVYELLKVHFLITVLVWSVVVIVSVLSLCFLPNRTEIIYVQKIDAVSDRNRRFEIPMGLLCIIHVTRAT